MTGKAAISFILVLFRISGIFVASPILMSRYIPAKFKLGFSLVVAIILFPSIPQLTEMPKTLAALAVYAAGQLLFGFFVGACVSMLFFSLQMAGTLMDLQIGFGMASMVDPQTREQTTVIARGLNFVAIIVFLVLNGHHWLFLGLINSFKAVPLDRFILSAGFIEFFIRSFSNILIIAYHIALPLIISILLVDVMMGFITKIAPQMNILIIAFPFKIAMGLFVVTIYMPQVMGTFIKYFDEWQTPIIKMFYL